MTALVVRHKRFVEPLLEFAPVYERMCLRSNSSIEDIEGQKKRAVRECILLKTVGCSSEPSSDSQKAYSKVIRWTSKVDKPNVRWRCRMKEDSDERSANTCRSNGSAAGGRSHRPYLR